MIRYLTHYLVAKSGIFLGAAIPSLSFLTPLSIAILLWTVLTILVYAQFRWEK